MRLPQLKLINLGWPSIREVYFWNDIFHPQKNKAVLKYPLLWTSALPHILHVTGSACWETVSPYCLSDSWLGLLGNRPNGLLWLVNSWERIDYEKAKGGLLPGRIKNILLELENYDDVPHKTGPTQKKVRWEKMGTKKISPTHSEKFGSKDGGH